MKVLLAGFAFAIFLAASAYAENVPARPDAQDQAQRFEESLHYQTGDVVIGDKLATLRLNDKFRYLGPADAERVLVQAWGNPKGSQTLGMLFPAGLGPFSADGWAVVVSYEEEGHVSDEDADSLNYDDLLRQMQEGVEKANESRRDQGYAPVKLLGWAEPPRYDKAERKLYWAKELTFDDHADHALNYNVRILGRKGVLVMNAVANMSQIGTVRQGMQQVLAFTDFNPGHTYGEFDPSVDTIAKYGLAALIAGGVAAKTGLLAKLVALAIAGKKFILLAVAALVGLGRKLFGRRKTPMF